MEVTLSFPLLLALVFGSALFTLFIFSFLVASKTGDEKMAEILANEDFVNNKLNKDLHIHN
ncbi:MAG: hypothetical protein JEY94_18340 [Melioribacteraceae bacterium]|nr:hypothetical protein [Melioribacteraceae bacterium]